MFTAFLIGSARLIEFDIECVDVLIGKPDTAEAAGKIEVLLEQLRQRQLSIEQIQTYERQSAAAEQERIYNEKKALAAKQQELTNSQVQIRIAENQGDADLARSRKQAEQAVVVAKAESESRVLSGRGESQRIMQIGLAEAAALMQKISSYGDPRLYALSAVADHLSKSAQPLVPQQLFVSGGSGEDGSTGTHGLLETLIRLLVAEKSGFSMGKTPELGKLREFVDRMSTQAIDTMQQTSVADAGVPKKSASGRLAPKGDGN